MVQDYYTELNLVTTVPELADPLSAEDAAFYADRGQAFEFVGPLLSPGAVGQSWSSDEKRRLFEEVQEAKEEGREVVYVSMGTVITGDHPEHGWHGRSGSTLTGRELCHAIYCAVFKVLGADAWDVESQPAPFVILSVGPQKDALPDVSIGVCGESLGWKFFVACYLL